MTEVQCRKSWPDACGDLEEQTRLERKRMSASLGVRSGSWLTAARVSWELRCWRWRGQASLERYRLLPWPNGRRRSIYPDALPHFNWGERAPDLRSCKLSEMKLTALRYRINVSVGRLGRGNLSWTGCRVWEEDGRKPY